MADRAAAGVPDQIGEFKVVKKVGEGSFGKVFLGKHSNTGSYVAIKSAKRGKDDRLTALSNRMIRAEAATLSQLTHRNIVKLYHALEEDSLHCMVLEFVSGIDLAKHLVSSRSAIIDREASSIIKSILEGLDYLHSKNIVHRDIKPSSLGFKRQYFGTAI